MKLVVVAPLLVEALAVRSGLPGVKVRRSGMGRREAALGDADVVGITGLCGGVDPALRAGDVVLATELRSDDGLVLDCPGSALLAEPLRSHGLDAVTGPLYTSSRILGPDERLRLRETGVLAVDMESAWLVQAAGDRSTAVLRVVVDTAERRLASPHTLLAGLRGLWKLRRTAPAFVDWAELCTAPAAGTLSPEVA